MKRSARAAAGRLSLLKRPPGALRVRSEIWSGDEEEHTVVSGKLVSGGGGGLWGAISGGVFLVGLGILWYPELVLAGNSLLARHHDSGWRPGWLLATTT